VVTGRPGRAGAVLIRALEPIAGLGAMARRRGRVGRDRLARGPGCVAQALGLDRTHDGADLTAGPLWLPDEPARRGGRRIARSGRVGISRAVERPWRFFLSGHPCVSPGPAAIGARVERDRTPPQARGPEAVRRRGRVGR